MYTVIWTSAALEELAGVWIEASPEVREAITTATERIDAVLRRSPNDVGESRPDGRRIAFEFPLAFLFRVKVADRSVIVSHAWSTERSTP